MQLNVDDQNCVELSNVIHEKELMQNKSNTKYEVNNKDKTTEVLQEAKQQIEKPPAVTPNNYPKVSNNFEKYLPNIQKNKQGSKLTKPPPKRFDP